MFLLLLHSISLLLLTIFWGRQCSRQPPLKPLNSFMVEHLKTSLLHVLFYFEFYLRHYDFQYFCCFFCFVLFLFLVEGIWSHKWLFSGLITGSVFRENPWCCSTALYAVQGFNWGLLSHGKSLSPVLFLQSLTILYPLPEDLIFFTSVSVIPFSNPHPSPNHLFS